MHLLNGVELPALEDGCVNKKLLVSCHPTSLLSLSDFFAGKGRREDETISGRVLGPEDENRRAYALDPRQNALITFHPYRPKKNYCARPKRESPRFSMTSTKPRKMQPTTGS